ncbi:MAG: type II secretion system protein [Candidatus Coatesbacteria bacterium]
MRKGRKEHGFTLIELMIVVAIIGILAALALPKFASLVEKSREAATKGNLNSMTSAVSIYYGDNEGVYPTWLYCSVGYSFSKYLENVPPVKATHSGIGSGIQETPSGTSVLHSTDEAITAVSTGWRYNSLNGHVFVNSSATDSKSVAYSTYGY